MSGQMSELKQRMDELERKSAAPLVHNMPSSMLGVSKEVDIRGSSFETQLPRRSERLRKKEKRLEGEEPPETNVLEIRREGRSKFKKTYEKVKPPLFKRFGVAPKTEAGEVRPNINTFIQERPAHKEKQPSKVSLQYSEM